MPNPATSHDEPHVLATVAIAYDIVGELVPLKLPRSLWQVLRIGDRLVVEGNSGEMFIACVELGIDESPILRLPARPDYTTTSVRVRRPRGGA